MSMFKRIIIGTTMLFCLLAYFCFWRLPESQTIAIQPLAAQKQALLVPLDSRPVCTVLPQRLAALAGINLILPPNELLDNYRTPAKTEKIQQWLTYQLDTTKKAYVSTDMLLAGSLIQARKQASTSDEQTALIDYLKELQNKNARLQLFQVIPRLLVSDELIPDRWYKYRLFRYSQLFDMVETFNDFHLTQQLQEYEAKIPAAILAKYCQLYQAQNQLDNKLITLTNEATALVIGQDDGEPFGLHHRSSVFAEGYMQKSHKTAAEAALSYGADELASVLVARSYLKERGYIPKAYIKYADSTIPNLIMPYLPVSVAGVIQEKLALLNIKQVKNEDQADFILYVNCGNDNYMPSEKQALELKQLLQGNKPLALIDLSANFEEKELLLPQALKAKAPLNRLCAYAGWNTFSNSAGTALAQAAIFTVRIKEITTSSQRLQFYTSNLTFNLERLLDDYVYQKKLHATLKKELLTRGIEPTELNTHDHGYAQALAQFFLQNQALWLLHTNLGLTPYYQDASGCYYLQNIKVTAQLPWSRIFEIKLNITPQFGISHLK